MSWRQYLAPLFGGMMIGLCLLMLRIVFVTGASMEPALSKGDICIVVRGLTVQEGDIIFYRKPQSRPVVHRVLAVTRAGAFVTQGDANEFPDFEPVLREELIGPVVIVIPTGAAVMGWKQATMDATLLNHLE